jgi:hypothetical protein
MSRILFVHNNFPAQFGFLAEGFSARASLARRSPPRPGGRSGRVPLARYRLERGSTPGLFAPATRAEADLLRADAAARAAFALRDKASRPIS